MSYEVWRPIKGFEGRYEVSNLGKVRSLNYKRTGKIKEMSLVPDGREYLQVALSKDGSPVKYRVNRLVAIAFIPNPNELPQVNHIDEDKTNNHVTNLEWCSAKYNTNHGTRTARCSDALSQAVEAFDLESGSVIHRFKSTREAGRAGFSSGNISSCCNQVRKSHKGLGWSYV
nr:MAG TPA: homing endonuclease [Caudoviricetes sp.]